MDTVLRSLYLIAVTIPTKRELKQSIQFEAAEILDLAGANGRGEEKEVIAFRDRNDVTATEE